MRLFLYGASGVGKTTIINDVIKSRGLFPKGFATKKIIDSDMVSRVYLNRFGASPIYNDSTLVASMAPHERPLINGAAFNRLGVSALEGILPGDLVVMDELGFLENDSAAFKDRVISVLDLECDIIGVIKARSNPFLDEIKARSQTIEVTKATRPCVYNIVDALLKGYIK